MMTRTLTVEQNLEEHMGVDLERGVHADPQHADLGRGANVIPQGVDLERGEQVDPQPLPAPSLDTGNLPVEVDEHEMDEQHHFNHDPETQIQVPAPEIPSNWQAPMVSYIGRELGNSMDLSAVGYTIWRPGNPGLPQGALEAEFDEFGVLQGVESDNEDQPRPQDSQQDDLKEDVDKDGNRMPALTNRFANIDGNADLGTLIGRHPVTQAMTHDIITGLQYLPTKLARKHHVLIPILGTTLTMKSVRTHAHVLAWQVLVWDLQTHRTNQVGPP